ncbi:MAG: hypothetical protein AAB152_17550 [Candidatus Coatesbacteria bacterium]
MMADRHSAQRLLAILLFPVILASCSGRERVLQKIGKDGYWHLERVAHRPLLSVLGRIPLLSSLVGDTGDRWWFVSPKGERSFLRMVSSVGDGEPASRAASFMVEAQRNLTAWGFNGFGFYVNEVAWAGMDGNRLPAVLYSGGGTIWAGIFDDWVPPTVEESVKGQAASLKDARDVLGLFYGLDGASSPRLLLLAYGSFPRESPSKVRLVEVIRRRCKGDLKQLWARIPNVKTFEELLDKRNWEAYDGADEDGEAFAKELYGEYGAIVRKSLRAHMPNYLALGPVLWPDTPIPVLRALAPHVDALSIFLTSADGRLSRRYFEEASRATGKPILIWAAGPQLREGQGLAVETEAGQAISFRRMASGSAALPFVAGFCWTKYRDGREDNVALLDRNGNRRDQVLNTIMETNGQLDRIHAEGAEGYYPEYYQEDRFAAGTPRQDLRRLPKPLAVDGDLADWPARGFWLENVKLARDLDPVVFAGARIGWDPAGLCLGVEVQDDAVELLDPRVYWVAADFVEVLIEGSGKRLSRYAPSTSHVVLLPRGGGQDGTSALAMIMHHEGDRWNANQYDAKAIETGSSFFRGRREFDHVAGIGRFTRSTRVSLRESSWKLEARIPWASIGIEPKPGEKIRFNLIVHRMGMREEEAFWAAPRDRETLGSPAAWGQLTIADEGKP